VGLTPPTTVASAVEIKHNRALLASHAQIDPAAGIDVAQAASPGYVGEPHLRPPHRDCRMSLKERLFGLPWEAKDAEARVRATTESTDPRLRDALPGLARSDSSPAVRLAALKRMDDEAAWLAARGDDSDAEVRSAADRSILYWVTKHEGTETLEARRRWLGSVEDGELLRRLATDAVDEPMRGDALARIDAQGFLGDRYCEEPNDELAQRILSRIEQVSTLKRVAERLRTRHKRRYHAALERLAELDGSQASDTREGLARELIDRIERLARGQSSGDRKAQADELQSRWEALGASDPALNRRFDGALKIVRRALEPRPAVAESPVDPSPVEERQKSGLSSQVDAVRALAAQPIDDETGPQLKALVTEVEQRWKSITASAEPVEERLRNELQHFNALADDLRARMQPSSPAPPAPERTAPAGPDPALLKDLDEAMQAAEQALEAGEIPPAHDAVSRARSAHDRLPKRHRPDDYAGRLSRMTGRLKEMRDWQHWSNNKLRERLIEHAEAIDPSEMHPDAVTERLKELRERWRALDAQEILPGEKRKFAAPHAQWRRFQATCKEAFEGAKPYLEKRSEVREESLDELKTFLTDARQLLDKESAERDLLVRHQRAARQAIRNLDQVPPKRRGVMAREIRSLMDAISARLDAASEAVEQEKRRLVAEARKLTHEKDRSVAIDRAKALQAAWKDAGRGRRKIEDALWKEFREPIDPLFEDLKQERDQQRELERAALDALKQLCERAEALAGSDEDELEQAAGPLSGLEDEFSQHGRVPPAIAQTHGQGPRDARSTAQGAERGPRSTLRARISTRWPRPCSRAGPPCRTIRPLHPRGPKCRTTTRWDSRC
jgi:exonuclease SbcC